MNGEDSQLEQLIGTTVDGRFVIQRLIGTGGTGAVYEAFHQGLGIPVAVKVLNSHVSLSTEALKRFQSEARLASNLSHPNIVAVHAFGILPDIGPYIAMELIDGVTLASELKEKRTLPKNVFVSVFKQCCAALSTVHEQGCIHRDIKPGNIMLLKQDNGAPLVKLTDFGIAKIFGEQNMQSLTRTGEILGTPLYMSPEQCVGSALDQRSDIYSLGCVMYEALTGEPPFPSDTPFEAMLNHVHKEVPMPDQVDKALASVVLHTLQKTADARPQSMAALSTELDKAAKGMPSSFKAVKKWRMPSWVPKAIAAGAGASIVLALLPLWMPLWMREEVPPSNILDPVEANQILGRLATQAEVELLDSQCDRVEDLYSQAPRKYTREMIACARIRKEMAKWAFRAQQPDQAQLKFVDKALRTGQLLKDAGTNLPPESNFSDLFVRRGELTEAADYKQALEFYGKATAVHDFHDASWELRARTKLAPSFYQGERLKEARDEYERVLELTEHTWGEKRTGQIETAEDEATVGLLRVYEQLDELALAEPLAQAVLAQSAKEDHRRKLHFAVLAEMAALYAEAGNLSKSKKYLSDLDNWPIRREKDSPHVHMLNAISDYAHAVYAEKIGDKRAASASYASAAHEASKISTYETYERFWIEKISAARKKKRSTSRACESPS